MDHKREANLILLGDNMRAFGFDVLVGLMVTVYFFTKFSKI